MATYLSESQLVALRESCWGDMAKVNDATIILDTSSGKVIRTKNPTSNTSSISSMSSVGSMTSHDSSIAIDLTKLGLETPPDQQHLKISPEYVQVYQELCTAEKQMFDIKFDIHGPERKGSNFGIFVLIQRMIRKQPTIFQVAPKGLKEDLEVVIGKAFLIDDNGIAYLPFDKQRPDYNPIMSDSVQKVMDRKDIWAVYDSDRYPDFENQWLVLHISHGEKYHWSVYEQIFL